MSEDLSDQPMPDDIWGLEALDPLEQMDWARSLWKRLQAEHQPKPLLLTFSAGAERAALRFLSLFSFLSREDALPCTYVQPGRLPLLPEASFSGPGLLLIHRASRFLNLKNRLAASAGSAGIRIILTAPLEEAGRLAETLSCTIEHVPEEEPAYAAQRSREIVAKFLAAGTPLPATLRPALQLVAQAGVAGVELPLDLLQRSLQVAFEDVLLLLAHPAVCDFVRLSGGGELEKRLVSFRGPWLARHIAGVEKAADCRLLLELFDHLEPATRLHRCFMLNVLVALRAQGNTAMVARLRMQHRSLILACQKSAENREALAWFIFLHEWLLSHARVFFWAFDSKVAFFLCRRRIFRLILIFPSIRVFPGKKGRDANAVSHAIQGALFR